ncbi:siderophore-interacting protein [Parahaliea mediterranea]|uniref:Siderophore-interacting protein n=1 Tax=Parahaliea mediterranea TaxID=651086 RepID=A0A939IMR6_9GAMM|nr:siderophore-interacting protein [Parahaliea mediterranea]MBN7797313.1 siderophore-interacting protein [Parahaliea mediterranea]
MAGPNPIELAVLRCSQVSQNVRRITLGGEARGYALIEVTDKADIQALEHPQNMEIRRVINPTPDPEGYFLAACIRKLPWLAGQPAVWSASEFSSMRTLRRLFKQEHAVPKSHLYISSYWKIGRSEDGQKEIKRQDAELQGE